MCPVSCETRDQRAELWPGTGEAETSAREQHSKSTGFLPAQTDLGGMSSPSLRPQFPHLNDEDNGTPAYAFVEELNEILAGKPLAQGLARRKHR